MKPKATTLQERMGFRDPDLGTPAHDDLVLWLIQNKVKVSKLLIRSPLVNELSEEDKLIPKYSNALEKVGVESDHKIVCISEHPVKSKDYVIGFIDVLLGVKRFKLSVVEYERSREKTIITDSEHRYVAIEVKPRISSFGEVLRQIRHYESQSATAGWKFAIFTPDLRFREAFEEQGVLCFWKDDVDESNGNQ